MTDRPPATPDLLVLGGGSGGYAAALRAAQLGLSVTLVEQDRLGGTCLHRGCVPTKAILHAGEVADTTRSGAQFGIHTELGRIVGSEILAYADGVVERLYRGLTGLVAGRGIDLVTGTGRLERATGPTTSIGVRVGDQLLTGRSLVLATGSLPATISGVEPDGVRILTSDHALRLAELPRTAIVLGGGVIGVEFASAWTSLGVAVTIVEVAPQLLPAEEPDSAAELQRAFRRRGIKVHAGVGVSSATSSETGVTVTLADGKQLTADLALAAFGRKPNTADLGCPAVGIELDRGWVRVNAELETSVPGTFAVGDLVPGLQLAHRGFAQGIFIAELLAYRAGALDRRPTPVRERELARITYSDPEVASVGLTEAAAKTEYGAVETAKYDLAGNARSQILKTRGFVKLVRRSDGPVVGIHLVGSRVSELISEAQLITGWDAYPADVAGLIHAHPTQAEAIGEAHLALAGKPLHAHR